MKRLRAVLFDLDGTLLDSAPDIGAALNAALASVGLAALELDHIKTMVGGGAHLLCSRALAAGPRGGATISADALLEKFIAHYEAHPCERSVLYPGARDSLERLKRQGLSLGLVTNKPDRLTQVIVDALALRPLFGCILGGQPALRLKPDPDMLLRACKLLGVAPHEALMVGDSRADLGAARSAGMACILLAHGYSSEPVHRMGADAVVDDFAHLVLPTAEALSEVT